MGVGNMHMAGGLTGRRDMNRKKWEFLSRTKEREKKVEKPWWKHSQEKDRRWAGKQTKEKEKEKYIEMVFDFTCDKCAWHKFLWEFVRVFTFAF